MPRRKLSHTRRQVYPLDAIIADARKGSVWLNMQQCDEIQSDCSYSTARVVCTLLESVGYDWSKTVLDLGSCFGRQAFYGALALGASVRGIEIVKSRVDEAIRDRERLGLNTVDFVHGDATRYPTSDAGALLLLNSFTRADTMNLLNRIASADRSPDQFILAISSAHQILAVSLDFHRLATAYAPGTGSDVGIFVARTKS